MPPNTAIPLINYNTSLFNNDIAIYMAGATVTVLASAYCLLSGACGRKTYTELRIEFFITVISFCFQTMLAVLSGINLAVF